MRTDINSPEGRKSASHWAFEEKNLAIQGCFCWKPSCFHLPVMGGCFLLAIPLIWEFLHLSTLLGFVSRFVFPFENLKLEQVLGLAAITMNYWLCWWLISLYLPHLLLPQIAPYSNWGHKIEFPSLAAFLILGFSPPASLDLLWLSFGTSIGLFLLCFNLFPCNNGCLLILLWRSTNLWPRGEFYCYQLLL